MATRFAKGQIVYLCSLMMMVFVVLCYLSIQQLRKSNKVRMMDEGIEGQHGLSLEIFKNDVDFFGYELNDDEFYKSGNSIYLTKHDSLLIEIRKLFRQPKMEDGRNDTVEILLNSYDSVFDELVAKIRLKGYRDYGLEGRMRSYAHQIEHGGQVPMVDYLTLRRHEKDYLLRSDTLYVIQFDALIKQLKNKAAAHTSYEPLDKYAETFHDLVSASNQIGLETQTHLKGKLDKLTKQLISKIEKRDAQADKETFKAYQQGLVLFAIGIIGTALLCLALIIVIARKF